MDISSFSSDNFDAKVWVNEILKNSTDKNDINYTTSLVMKLQLYVQQVNNSLEQSSQQVLASLPKIVRDTKNLQQEAFVLKEKMAVVKEEIIKIEHDTRKSINTIEKLDDMKNQLYLAKQGLHESDNWTILVNDLEEVFDSKNIENISTKILGMQNSLKLLVNVADYEDRKLQLEGLKNRLEAIASPAIVQAFSTYNTEQSLTFVRIFTLIGRLPQLMKYYTKCQKDILVKKWRDQLEIEQDESVIQWIHNYYDILLSNWHMQYKWFNQVFSSQSAVDILIDVYIDVLGSLDPSFNECIDAALKQVPDKLAFLGEIKDVTKQFAQNMVNIVEQCGLENISTKILGMQNSLKLLVNVADYEDRKLQLEGLKNRLEAIASPAIVQAFSTYNTGMDDSERLLNLLQSIHSHLVPYVNKYAAYEQANLIKQMSAINCMKEELSDTIQALGLSIPSVIDLARDAKKRCQIITENTGFCGLLIALRAFFSNYAGYYRVALRQIDRNKKSDEDWGTFQLCLSLLQNCGEVLLKIQNYEKDLTNNILDLFNMNKKICSIEYKHLLLNKSDLKEYESLVKCVTEGTQLSLLDQSITEFNKLCSDIHHTTYQVVFGPISTHLDTVQSPKTWSQFDSSTAHNADLPDYSFSPQEYITQIGQYLMTIPQHLEPFLFRENPSLSCALKAVDQEYANAVDTEGALAEIFLKIIARGTCQTFCDKILSICELSQPASRQLSHDIYYLNNVLQDLGIKLSENLQQLSALLKLPSEQYQAQSIGYSARYVAAVRQMRNITSN